MMMDKDLEHLQTLLVAKAGELGKVKERLPWFRDIKIQLFTEAQEPSTLSPNPGEKPFNIRLKLPLQHKTCISHLHRQPSEMSSTRKKNTSV